MRISKARLSPVKVYARVKAAKRLLATDLDDKMLLVMERGLRVIQRRAPTKETVDAVREVRKEIMKRRTSGAGG